MSGIAASAANDIVVFFMATPSAGVSSKMGGTGLLEGLDIGLPLSYDNREAGTSDYETAFASQYRKIGRSKLAPLLLLAVNG